MQRGDRGGRIVDRGGRIVCCNRSSFRSQLGPLTLKSHMGFVHGELTKPLRDDKHIYAFWAQWQSAHLLSPCFSSLPIVMAGINLMMRHVSCILLLEWSATSQRPS